MADAKNDVVSASKDHLKRCSELPYAVDNPFLALHFATERKTPELELTKKGRCCACAGKVDALKLHRTQVSKRKIEFSAKCGMCLKPISKSRITRKKRRYDRIENEVRDAKLSKSSASKVVAEAPQIAAKKKKKRAKKDETAGLTIPAELQGKRRKMDSNKLLAMLNKSEKVDRGMDNLRKLLEPSK